MWKKNITKRFAEDSYYSADPDYNGVQNSKRYRLTDESYYNIGGGLQPGSMLMPVSTSYQVQMPIAQEQQQFFNNGMQYNQQFYNNGYAMQHDHCGYQQVDVSNEIANEMPLDLSMATFRKVAQEFAMKQRQLQLMAVQQFSSNYAAYNYNQMQFNPYHAFGYAPAMQSGNYNNGQSPAFHQNYIPRTAFAQLQARTLRNDILARTQDAVVPSSPTVPNYSPNNDKAAMSISNSIVSIRPLPVSASVANNVSNKTIQDGVNNTEFEIEKVRESFKSCLIQFRIYEIEITDEMETDFGIGVRNERVMLKISRKKYNSIFKFHANMARKFNQGVKTLDPVQREKRIQNNLASAKSRQKAKIASALIQLEGFILDMKCDYWSAEFVKTRHYLLNLKKVIELLGKQTLAESE